MGVHLRLARPIEDGPANRRIGNRGSRGMKYRLLKVGRGGWRRWISDRGLEMLNKKCILHENSVFSRRDFCAFFEERYLVLRRLLFFFRGSMGFKKKRGSGLRPLEDPYCGRISVKVKRAGCV